MTNYKWIEIISKETSIATIGYENVRMIKSNCFYSFELLSFACLVPTSFSPNILNASLRSLVISRFNSILLFPTQFPFHATNDWQDRETEERNETRFMKVQLKEFPRVIADSLKRRSATSIAGELIITRERKKKRRVFRNL